MFALAEERALRHGSLNWQTRVVQDQRITGVELRRILLVGLVFVANGSLVGALWPRIPEFSDRLGIGPAALGWVFSLATAGSLAGTVLAPRLIRATGGRRAVRGSLVVYVAAAIVMFSSRAVWLATLAFAIVGFCDGVVDVGMNVAASHLESGRVKPLMSRFHAAWAGGVLGFSVVSVLTIPLLGLVWVGSAIAIGTGLMALIAVARWDFTLEGGARDVDLAGQRPSRSLRPLAIIGLMAALGSVVESVPVDWGALAVEDRFSPERSVAGLAVVLTLVGAILGRLGGDRAVAAYGARRSLAGFLSLAGAGLALIVWAGSIGQALIGFWLVGLGTATVFPVAIMLGTRVVGTGRERAVSVVSSTSRVAILIAPLVIGPVAETFGFGPAFLIPLALNLVVLGWAWSGQRSTSARQTG